MGIKNWLNQRKEFKESQQRFNELTEEEMQELGASEKFAYLEVAKKQVTYRGKINAYKDFPIGEAEKQEIDIEDGLIEVVDESNDDEEEEEDDEDEEDEDEDEDEEELSELPKIKPTPTQERDNEINTEPKNVYQTVQRM